MPPDRTPLRILAFEPYDGGSHRAVRERLSTHSRHEWTWISRPARAWKWRLRTASIEMVDDAARQGVLDERIDVLFAGSLMSAADLRALLPARLRSTPIVLYMHENQVAYPAGPGGRDSRDLHFALTNLTSMLAADRVVWNSDWNRRSFSRGITDVLRHAPDGTLTQVTERVEARSTVLWPPVDAPPHACAADRPLRRPARVCWPHRWEHDKGPDTLLRLARRCTERHDLRWTILGERFRTVPPALRTFEHEFASRIDHIGYVEDRDAYLRLVADCDWVLSTARHEFFGLAVAEALLAGCLPWLPHRLSYPELLPPCAHRLSPSKPPQDPAAIRTAIRSHLEPAVTRHAVARLDAALAGTGIVVP